MAIRAMTEMITNTDKPLLVASLILGTEVEGDGRTTVDGGRCAKEAAAAAGIGSVVGREGPATTGGARVTAPESVRGGEGARGGGVARGGMACCAVVAVTDAGGTGTAPLTIGPTAGRAGAAC